MYSYTQRPGPVVKLKLKDIDEAEVVELGNDVRKKLYRTSEQKTAHTHSKAKLVLEWRYQPLVSMFRNHIKEQLDADSPYLFLTVGGE